MCISKEISSSSTPVFILFGERNLNPPKDLISVKRGKSPGLIFYECIPSDLRTVLLQILESQVEVRQKEVGELQGQSQALSQEGKGSDEVDGQRISVEQKFQSLQDPLKKRRDNLMASREIHQFNRDVEDEIVSGGRAPTFNPSDSGSEACCTGSFSISSDTAKCHVVYISASQYLYIVVIILVLLNLNFLLVSSCGWRRGCLWPHPPTTATTCRPYSWPSRRTRYRPPRMKVDAHPRSRSHGESITAALTF